MKLKQFIFALVAMLSSFAFTANAQTSVSTFDELKAALGTETQIKVVGDIAVEEAITIPSGTTVNGDGTLHVQTMVYVVSTETPYPGVTYNKTATKNGSISGTVSCTVVYKISLDGGESWFTDTTNGKAQAVTVKKDGTKTISTSFQSAFTSAKCGEIVHMLTDAHVKSTNTSKNNGPLRSYYGLILEGNGHTIYTDVEASGASNEYSTIKFTSYLAGTGADVRPVLKNVTIDSQKNAKADLDLVSGDVTFTVSLYNVNLLNKTANASLSFISGTSMVVNKSNVKLFDSSIPAWDAGSAKAIEFYSGSYSLSLNSKCKVYGGSFSKSVSTYIAANHVQKQVNGKYVVTRKEGKVETAPSVSTDVEGDVANELVSNTAAKDEVELPADVANFTVQLTAVESNNDATTKITFSVTPSNVLGEKVSTPSEAITFRLPVPAAWSGKAKVSHEGEELGVYDINEANGAKYVEVESANFSLYTIEPITVYEVATYEALIAALANEGAFVKMTADITATATQSSGYGKAGIVVDAGDVLDGNGKTLTINGAGATWDCAIAMRGGEVKNLTIAGAMRGIFMPGANGDVVVDNCEFENVVYTFNSDAGSKDYTVTIKNTTLNGWTSFSNVHKSVTFESCTFGKGSGYAFCRPYQATTFTNCTFAVGYELDTKSTSESLSFNECTYNGDALSAENIAMFYNGGKVLINGEEINVTSVAKIGDKRYNSLEAAVDVAQAGETIELLADAELSEKLTLPAGITFNGNGKAITGAEVWAAGDLTFVGHTKVQMFNAGYNKPTITIGEGACLELTSTGRMVIGHGATFNITGTIAENAAKTANVADLTPSLIMAGASFTGAGVTFNVTNAYIKATAYCSSKNSNASGTFDFNIENSIWEQTGSFVFTEPTNGKDPIFNLNFKDGVLNSTSHLVFAVTKGEIIFDNSNVNGESARRQIENRSTMTIKNGAVVYGAVATSSNAKNPGTLTVDNATYNVTGEFSGSDLGTGTLIIKKGATVSAGSITKANIVIDATDMTAGELANFTANLSGLTGTLSVINNDKLEAKIVDGKIVLAEKPVAKIGDVEYTSLQAAVAAVKNNETIVLMADIEENVTVTEKTGLYYTIDGDGKTMTGTITVSSLSDTEDNRRITIKNIKFVDTVNGRDFITSTATNHYPRITVEGCSFTGTGKEAANSVAVRLKSSHSVVIKDCTGTGLHSFLQNTSGWNLTIENVTVTDSKSGFALGTVQGVTVKGANIDVAGYGIRLDAGYNNNAVIESNTVKAFIPVVVRKATVDSDITVKGTNNFTATNNGGYWMAIGKEEFEAGKEEPAAAESRIVVKLNDAGLNAANIYGNWVSTWGGIDWTLTHDGTLIIKPTAGTPTTDNSGKWTYEVGQWPEAVKYNSKGEAVAIALWPYDRSKVKTLIIEEGVTSIGSFAAQGFTNLTGEVVIPYTVKYIGQEAFQKSTMTKLTFAPVPEGKTGEELCIAQGALKNLIIEEIAFPADRPVHLHAWMFANSNNLKHVTFPATIKGIGGTVHVDYAHNPNATHGGGSNSCGLLSKCPALETITFGSQEVRDLYYNPYYERTDAPMVVNVGLKSYRDFRAGIDAAQDGETVLLLGNVTLDDTWTIPAGMNLTLNLNGKTISQEKECTASYEMINNKGNLNIVGSGKISFKDTGAGDPNFGWGSYTVRNEGNLVVEKATIEHKGAQAFGTHCIMAIYQYSGSTTINGGTISTPNYRSARLWKGDMTINDGTFDGQVWVQAVDNTAKLTITGGTFEPNGGDASAVFVTNSDHDVQLAVANGTFNGKIGCSDATKLAGAITGGKFNEAAKNGTNAALLVAGSIFGTEAEADGYFGLVDDPDTHYINNVEEFVAFRDAVNAGNDFAGVAVYLTADIDLAGIDWSVNIGDDCSATFDGTFDGQGHTIKNLTSTETAQKGDGYICTGLFGAIHGGAVLKNFTIENVDINTGDFTGNNVAAVVGFAYKATGSIENVKVTGDININAAKAVGVGAIIGYDYYSPALKVKNCVVSGKDGSAIVGKSYTGGLIGYASSKIAINENTVEKVSVTATGSVGAIAGIMLGGSSATDNIVKNVALTTTGELWANSAAVVAGTITSGGVTVTDNIVENVTANGVAAALVGGQLVEKPTAPIAKVEAKIGDKYYTTLDAALATQGEATVELLVPVTVAAGETRVINLNGKTVTGVDNATGSYAMITNKGNLTINGEGAIKLTATINRGWNAYSSVISNTVGGKLTVNGGTIEHLGGTDMAYAIDNLTNGKGTYAETVINGGTVKSTYRAVRQFLNGVEAQNILTVNGGTIEGANKSIWMQDPSKNANTGTLTVAADAVLKGDVYLFVTAGSTEWPVEVAIANAAFATGTVVTGNVPAQYAVANVNGVWSNVSAVAAIDGVGYATLAAAVEAAKAGDTITLLQDVKESVTISKNLSIDGAGNTITGMITTDGKSLKVTVKNVNFDGNNKTVNYAMRADDDLNLVVENCTVNNYIYGFLYANKSNDKIVVKNVTVENCAEYGAYLVSFNSATFEDFVVKGATKYGVAIANAKARTVNFKNVSFENAETPLSINEIGTGKVTFTFEGVNDMSKAEFYTSQYVNVVAAAQVGTKVCGSLQDAVAAAQNGETVKLLSDFVLNTATVTTQVDGYAVLVNVKDKAITIDLNGKQVTVNASAAELAGTKGSMLMAVFHADPNSELILTDSSDDATGTVELIANDAKVYSFIVSENAGDKTKSGKIVVNGGNYIADKLSDSMIYADTDEVITVNGGNFHLDNTGTSTNGKPWIFNTLGANQIQVLVNGGTYNTNIGEQYYRDEFKLGNVLTIRDNEDETWSVVAGATFIDGQFTEYTNNEDVEGAYIHYERNILKTYSPIFVPFDIEITEDLAAQYEIFYINDIRNTDKNYDGIIDEQVMELIYINGGNADGTGKTLLANQPYFMRSKSGNTERLVLDLHDVVLYAAATGDDADFDCTSMYTKYVVTGNNIKHVRSDFGDHQYVMGTDGSWGHLKEASALNPFRFYLTITNRDGSPVKDAASQAISVRVVGEESEDGTTVIYDVKAENNDVEYIYDLGGRRVLNTEKGLYIINGKKVLVK